MSVGINPRSGLLLVWILSFIHIYLILLLPLFYFVYFLNAHTFPSCFFVIFGSSVVTVLLFIHISLCDFFSVLTIYS